jgi:hypothetical protein
LTDLTASLSDQEIFRLYEKEIGLVSLQDMPFVKSSVPALLKAMLPFPAIIFGRDGDAAVAKQYNALFWRFAPKLKRWRSIAATQNFLRDLVVQTDLATGREVKTAVRSLERMQGMTGIWQENINPYLTVNALGHLNMPEADRQIKKACARLVHTQNRNGTWGSVRQE